jgi:hypothetical protein
MVGDKIFDAYWPKKLYNHDAEDPDNMSFVGETDQGESVELNRRAVESDLVIYVNLNLVPDGRRAQVAWPWACAATQPEGAPQPEGDAQLPLVHGPPTSELNTSVERMGKVTEQKKRSTCSPSRRRSTTACSTPAEFLAKNEDDLTAVERRRSRADVHARQARPTRRGRRSSARALALRASPASSPARPRRCTKHTLKRCFEQYCVPVEGQADILVTGIPYISPYNVNAFLNPLLVQVMANGLPVQPLPGQPMVKKGGTMIMLHPCTDKFDNEQHAPYIEFVHRLLPETRDAMELHKRYEASSRQPGLHRDVPLGHAYHPAHPFFMWYWGEAGRQHVGRVIVVGADNEYIPKLLGWETARTMDEARSRCCTSRRCSSRT